MQETAPSPSCAWGASGPTINDTKTMVDAIEAQYQSARQGDVDSLYSARDNLRTSLSSWMSYCKSLAQTTVIGMVNDDTRLVSKDISTALTELIRQMVSSANTVCKNTVSGSVAAVSTNTGNATVIVSVVGPDGKNRENVFAENIVVKVTSDSGLGATSGSEPCSIRGATSVSDALNWEYPKGSGASTTITVTDPTINQGNNMLYNSDFEDWGGVPTSSANCPDHFAVLVGTPGTDILKETSITYGSTTGALKILGDGATLSSIAQTFNSSTGTTSTLAPNGVYAFNAYVRVSTVPGAGVLVFSLLDGSNAVINDDAGTANTISVSLPSATTSYVAKNGFFRMPKVMPTTVKLAVRLTTALTNTFSAYIDEMALKDVSSSGQAYTGGPYIAAFQGSTDVIKNDAWNITISNDYLGNFQSYFDRFFGTGKTTGLILPSATSGANTILESLTL